MTVKGLMPFIRKYCPRAITPLTSISQLSGKTVAIDGHLQTIKCHHVPPSNFPSCPFGEASPELFERTRHVRGWYYFIRGLEKQGIKAVVVFDGPTRLEAKKAENERRQQRREENRQRSLMEERRQHRMQMVRSSLDLFPLAAENRPVAAEGLETGGPDTSLLFKFWHQDFLAEKEVNAEGPAPTSSQIVLQREEEHWWNDVRSAIGEPLEVAHQILPEMVPAVRRLEDSGSEETSSISVLNNPPDDVARHSPPSEACPFSSPSSPCSNTALAESSQDWRQPVKEALAKLIERSGNFETAFRMRGFMIPDYALSDSRRLLQVIGLPVLKPKSSDPREAETVCCALWQKKVVDFVVSDDTDVIACGAPVIRFLKVWTPKGPFLPKTILEELNFTRDQFVDFCLLCGTDFTDRIRGCGPETALKLLRQYGSIESILDSQTKFQPPDVNAYLQSVIVARNIYLDLPSLAPEWQSTLTEASADSHDLQELLDEWKISASVDFTTFDCRREREAANET